MAQSWRLFSRVVAASRYPSWSNHPPPQFKISTRYLDQQSTVWQNVAGRIALRYAAAPGRSAAIYRRSTISVLRPKPLSHA
jgi:hypothetical protein